eukprot:7882218-Heterocapsa_arctica.AAC.1
MSLQFHSEPKPLAEGLIPLTRPPWQLGRWPRVPLPPCVLGAVTCPGSRGVRPFCFPTPR